MLKKLLIIAFLHNQVAIAQSNLMDWNWFHGQDFHNHPIQGFSSSISLKNIYGTDELSSLSAKLRFDSKDSRSVTGVGLEWLPTQNFNYTGLSFHFTYNLSPPLSLGVQFKRNTLKFSIDGASSRTDHISLTGSLRKSPVKGSVSILYQATELYKGQQNSIEANLNLIYKINSAVTLLIHLNTPSPVNEPMLELELHQYLHDKWGYGIGIGMPSPYFGLRFFMKISKDLAIDINSRRHPFLGFSHSSSVLFRVL